MQQAAIAERKLYQNCKKLGISDPGFKWMDVALDPFKDLEIKPTGYPDRIMTASVVQTIHGTFDVHSPLGVGQNWDCNIFVDQIYDSVLLKASPSINEYIFAASAQTGPKYPRGGIIVRAAAAGTTLDIPQTILGQPLDDSVYTNALSRVIAIGMEIHNTTAELSRQGSLITYRIPALATDEIVTSVLDGTGVATCTSTTQKAIFLVEPPLTASLAEDLPGSLSWKAAEGAYIVPIFVEEDNKPSDLSVSGVLCQSAISGLYYPPIITIGTQIATPDTEFSTAKLPTSLSGVYLTGLSDVTTLTVKYVYYVETFPKTTSFLKRIASHSCPEDFVAIKCYTDLAKMIPTGVPVKDNFLGAFIAGISRLAAWVLPKIPAVIRAAQVVGAGVSAANDAFQAQQNPVIEARGKRQPRVEEIIEIKQQPRNSTNRQIVVHQKKPKKEKVVEIIERDNTSNVPRVAIVEATSTGNGMRTGMRSGRNRGNNDFMMAETHGNTGSRWIGS